MKSVQIGQVPDALDGFWKSLGSAPSTSPPGTSATGSKGEGMIEEQGRTCGACQAIGRNLQHHVSRLLPPSAFRSMDLGSLRALAEKTSCSTCQQIVHIATTLSCKVASDWRVTIRPGFCRVLRLHYSGYSSCPPLVFDIRFTNDNASVPIRAHNNTGSQYIVSTSSVPLHPPLPQMNIIDPQSVDIGRLRRLLDHCKTHHSQSCDYPSSPDFPDLVPLYLIDVHRKCLVPGSTGQRYVALSYLWGAAAGDFKTTCSNLHDLLKGDSLSTVSGRFRVPKTIQDAMWLTLALGETFLWVDRYSIVQDDEATKAAQIQGMASIYGSAVFAIIAAEGDNSHCGLPGISEGSHTPRKPQRVLSFGADCKLVEWAADPMLLPSTTWASRAWTFQENLCSRRKIIFYNGRVEWRCQQHLVLEDCNLPLDVWSYDLQFANLRLSPWPNLPQYVDLVQQYCRRHLSYDDDALAAFTGVLNLYRQSFPGGYHFGLPELFFDIAMLWQPRCTIRQRYPFGKPHDGKRLPSWSWVRWHGQLDMSLCQLEYLVRNEAYRSYCRTYPILEWYKIERASGRREKIGNSYALYRDSEFIPEGWSRHPAPPISGPCIDTWYEQPKYCFQHESDAVQKFWYPISLSLPTPEVYITLWEPYIQTRCERAYLAMRVSSTLEIRPLLWEDAVNDYSTVQESDSPQEVCLMDGEGQWVGILRLNGILESEMTDVRCELIAISRGIHFSRSGKYEKTDRAWLSERILADTYRTGPLSGFYEFYNVLWIEWHDGVAYRKALGRVEKSMWERQRRDIINVTLG